MRGVLILSLFLISCSSLKKASFNQKKIALSLDNIKQLDGEYEIFSNSSSDVTLDLALTFKKYWWGDFDEKEYYKLFIEILDNKQLRTTVYKDGELIASKTLKFKIVDGDLLIKKNKISPFYLILNIWGSMTTRLTLLENGNFMVDHDNSQVATFFIIPVGGNNTNCYRLEFKKRSGK